MNIQPYLSTPYSMPSRYSANPTNNTLQFGANDTDRLSRRINRRLPDARPLNLALAYLHHIVRTGTLPHRKNPRTIQEYIFQLKTSPEMAQFSDLVDKESSKTFFKSVLPEQYTIETLGVFNQDSLQDLAKFQQKTPYIIKPTHMSGDVIIKKDPDGNGNIMVSETDVATCQRWLKQDFFRQGREYNYKNLEPKIIIEPLLSYQGSIPIDYKFHVIHGKCELIEVFKDRFDGTGKGKLTADYYDRDGNRIKLRRRFPNSEAPPEKLQDMEEMIRVAETLGKKLKERSDLLKYSRIDLYRTDEGVKIGEVTLTPGMTAEKLDPPEKGKELLELIRKG